MTLTPQELARLEEMVKNTPELQISQESVEAVCRAISDRDSTDEQKMLAASELGGIDAAIAQHNRAQGILAQLVLGTIGPEAARGRADGLHRLAVALLAFGWKLRGEHDKRAS